MASKPRKAFDGIGRPQGFIDDAAKAAYNAVKKKAGMSSYYTYFKDEITGKADKEIGRIKFTSGKTLKKPRTTADQRVSSRQRDESIRAKINRVEKKPRMTADQKISSRERDENIRANYWRVEGAPRIKRKK